MNQRALFTEALNTLNEPLEAHLQRLSPAWQDTLKDEPAVSAVRKLSAFLSERLAAGAEIYPRHPFRALDYVQPDTARVIILGQDPYHGPNQAQGLAFSVPDICRCPPSLRNIFTELSLEYPDAAPRKRHNLGSWAEQGALLLNAALTVESGNPASHARKGWEEITDAIIQSVADSPQPKVFLLWGAHAQSKRTLLAHHSGGPLRILAANHPSPLSARRPPVPFIGCGHFAQTNDWLREHGQPEIDWLA